MVGDNVGVAGLAGASSNVTVHVYRVCGANGCPTSAIVSAIYAATDAGVVAMNLSLGGGSLSQSEADAIQYATDNDALVIASATRAARSQTTSIQRSPRCPATLPEAASPRVWDKAAELSSVEKHGDYMPEGQSVSGGCTETRRG